MDALINTNKFMSFQQLGADIDGEAPGDSSASSVSLSGDGRTVAIGATSNSGGGTHSGHVRVYKHNGTVWDQMGADIDGEAGGDLSGWSVSLSDDGETVAIGATYNVGNGLGIRSGHVRIYRWSEAAGDSAGWVQRGADIDGEAGGDMSGWSVSLSDDGQKVAIGAAYNDGNGSPNGGHVRIYSWETNTWVKRGADIDGEAPGDMSGMSVSLSGDGETVAIGALYNDGNGDTSGHVRIYTWSEDDGWDQIGADIDGEAPGDASGSSVSLSTDGQTVAIGATINSGGGGSQRGHVRVYKHNVTGWVQRGPDIDGDGDFDLSGNSVSLSGDGETMAIGAAYNNNGPGYVKVYSWETNTWVERGHIDGEADGDRSGSSVSLSTDGETVAIGAVFNDGNGSLSGGHVRIYTSSEDAGWVASISADPYIMTMF